MLSCTLQKSEEWQHCLFRLASDHCPGAAPGGRRQAVVGSWDQNEGEGCQHQWLDCNTQQAADVKSINFLGSNKSITFRSAANKRQQNTEHVLQYSSSGEQGGILLRYSIRDVWMIMRLNLASSTTTAS